ncbi:MAG TPA: hypothetical protein VGK29_12870 [Paludibaculum sp.]|jgi:imidazole glycerol phosphate synthase subunit HisF
MLAKRIIRCLDVTVGPVNLAAHNNAAPATGGRTPSSARVPLDPPRD